MPFEFWRWTTEEDRNKRAAADLIENARKMREEADRAQLDQHVGGIIESFQRDVQSRMEPLTSRFNSYMASAATPPPPPRPAPQPEESPVDRVMKSFTGKTAQQAARDATSWMDPVMNPVMEVLGTNDMMKRRDEMQGILDRQKAATPEPSSFAERIKSGVNGSSIGGAMTAPDQLTKSYADANPEDAKRYGELYQDDTLGALGSVGGGIKIAGGAFQQAAGTVVRGAAQKKVAESYGRATPSVDLGLKDWKYKYFDDLAPVQGVMNDLEKAFGRKLSDKENAYEILRLGRASAEVGDAWYRNHVGDVLNRVQGISGSVAQGRADLNDYLRAKDAIDKAVATPNRNFGGMKKADAEQALLEMQARLGGNFAELEKSADQFYKLGDFLLDRKVQAGLVSIDDANALKQMYPHYMPIQVIDWLDDNLARTATRVGKVGGGANDIKKLTELGTDRQAEEPLQAFYRAAERTAMLTAKNEAANAIVDASRQTPYLKGLIRPADNATAKLYGQVTTGPSAYARKPGESELRMKIGGKNAVFYVDRALEPLVAFGSTMGDDFLKSSIFAKAANLTRKASIAYNPVWGAGQLIMDSLAFLVKEGGFSDPKSMWRNAKYLGEGVKQSATKGNVYKIAAEAGALPGTIDHVSGVAGSFDKVVGGMTGRDVTSAKEFVAWAKDNALGGLASINERFDAVPRLAEFSRSMDAGKALQKSALAARDITIDPSRGGAWVKQVNAVVPFFNVAFQGAAYTPRMLRNSETRDKAMMGITSSVILPTMALEYLNQRDPRYKDVPDFDKDRGFIVMAPGGGKIDPNTGVEKPTYFLIRTGPFTPFVSLGRAMYNAASGQDPDLFKTGRAIAKAQLPIDVTQAADEVRKGTDPITAAFRVGAANAPAGIRQGIEVLTNYDTFRDRSIVPKGLENQPAERQFTNDTSETAKYIGGLTGFSPAKLDHLLKAWGGAADFAVDVFDAGGQAVTTAVKATTGLDTGFGSSGESQRMLKLRRDLAKTGLSDDERATIEGEIAREEAIKADRDSAVRNKPGGQLMGRYYREIGAQTVEDRVEAVERALLEKKRDKSPVGKELERLAVGFSDVKGQIGGVTLTREAAATYREKALQYRERLLSDLVGQEFYKQSDDEGKKRLLGEVMQRGAGWAAAEAAQSNPVLLDKLGTGSEFITDQIGADINVAASRYMNALRAQAELDEKRATSRYVNVKREDYAQVSKDRSELSQWRQVLGEREAEMVFMSRYGAERLARAKTARESKFWDSHLESFKRQNPDFALFDATKSKVITRQGLDAQAVARLAGL